MPGTRPGMTNSQIPLVLHLRDALRVGGREMPPALQKLERVLLVGEADGLGARETKQRMVARLRLPRGAVRVLPRIVDVDVAVTPLGAALVVERRALVVGACGRRFLLCIILVRKPVPTFRDDARHRRTSTTR